MEASSATISLLENHEQQYAVISADITSKIGKLSSCIGSDRKPTCVEVEKLIEDGHELLEQMELEVRDVNSVLRSKYTHRISSYKAELTRLSQDFSRIKSKRQLTSRHSDYEHLVPRSSNDELYAEYKDMNAEQKERLLDTTELIEETGKHLANGYRIAIETEELGSNMLQNLHSQRETIQSSLNRVHETNANVRSSSQILTGMVNRSIQHRLIVGGIFAFLILIVVVTIYHKI